MTRRDPNDPAIRREKERGFTLLEIMIALGIGGLILMSAHLMVTVVHDAAEETSAFVTEWSRVSNGTRALRALVGQLEVSSLGDHFRGDAARAEFTSWCLVPSGWLERCRVTLGFDSLGAARALTGQLSTGETIVFRRGFQDGKLIYLLDGGDGGTWVRDWGRGISAPVAVVAILRYDGGTRDSQSSRVDTLFLRTGER